MSDFIAEARVRVTPDTSEFRRLLQAQLAVATSAVRPVTVPIVPVVSKTAAAQVNGAAVAAAGLTQENQQLTRSTLQVAGAQEVLAASTQKSTAAMLGAGSASARLDAGLLGLRTALGSTAVIGLGAVSLAAIAAGQALRKMLIDTAAFEQELNTFQATTGATAEQMQAVSEAANRLGADIRLPAVSAADAAIAMTELAKAGLSVQDSIAGAEGVLQLATAAQISNAEAAQIAANALNSFGLAGSQATKVADDFANAANAAQGSIADMGLALQQSSAVARQVGLSLEDTVAILSLFAKNGLQGSDAGTSLRVALIRLVAPTQKAADEIKKLGLQIRDAQGNLRPDVFAQFGQATKDLAPAARDAAAALIFGQDAIRAVSIGAREGADGLKLMQFEIDQTGTASDLASARTKGLAGQFSALQSNLQTLGISIGALVSGPLTLLLKTINDAVSATDRLVSGLKRVGAVDIPPINIDVGFNVHLPGGRLGDFLGNALGIVGTGVARQTILGPAAFPLKLLDIAGLFQGTDKAKQQIQQLQDQLQRLQKARVEAFKGGDEGLADRLTTRIENIKRQIDTIAAASGSATSATAEQIQHLKSAIDALQGTGSAAAIASLNTQIKNLEAGLQASGAPVRDFSTDLGHLSQAATSAASSIDKTAAAAHRLAQAATEVSDKIQAAQAAGASPQAIIALTQQDIAAQQAIIANAERGGRQAGDITTIRKARAQIIADNATIKSLEADIAADQKKTAQDIKDKRDAADQAILDTFATREERAQNAIARAGSSSLKSQLAAQNALLVILSNELQAIKNTVKNAKTRAKEIARVTKEMIAVGQEIARIRRDQRKAIEDAAQQRRDFQQSHLEALLSIAETTETKTDDRKRLAALAAFDRAQIARIEAIKKTRKLTIEEKTQLDAYRVDLAQRTKAIKDLTEEQKKSNAAASAFFGFLQTQAGFAANLLGNLIPGFATGGLVGGTTGGGTAATAAAGLRQVPGGFEQPRGAVQAAGAVSSARERGVRPVQVDTTNAILRAILRQLQALNGRSGHPEARYERSRSTSAFDIFEHGGGS